MLTMQRRALFLTLLSALSAIALVAASKGSALSAGDLSVVTCGSVIKLAHIPSGYRLHSHEVKYGSGSGQQSVTGFAAGDDSNSYWLVQGGDSTDCQQGSPVTLGMQIRLTHVSTKRNLHSHHVTSPLTHQQEVSCYGEQGEGDAGDNWSVESDTASSQFWERGKPVQLKHTVTGQYLTTDSGSGMFNANNCGQGCPIAGQTEIAATSQTRASEWKTSEGVYFSPRND